MSAPDPHGAERQMPDRFFWNLAILLLIPVLVLLVAAWLVSRKAGRAGSRGPAPAEAAESAGTPSTP